MWQVTPKLWLVTTELWPVTTELWQVITQLWQLTTKLWPVTIMNCDKSLLNCDKSHLIFCKSSPNCYESLLLVLVTSHKWIVTTELSPVTPGLSLLTYNVFLISSKITRPQKWIIYRVQCSGGLDIWPDLSWNRDWTQGLQNDCNNVM